MRWEHYPSKLVGMGPSHRGGCRPEATGGRRTDGRRYNKSPPSKAHSNNWESSSTAVTMKLTRLLWTSSQRRHVHRVLLVDSRPEPSARLSASESSKSGGYTTCLRTKTVD